MTFAEWKSKSGTYQKVYYRNSPGDILLVCQAAYKAGERDGRKQVEAIAKNAIELREISKQSAGTERGGQMQNEIKVCWPIQWIEAAQRAGFALYGEDGRWLFISDKLRDMLAQFAEEIITADRKIDAKQA